MSYNMTCSLLTCSPKDMNELQTWQCVNPAKHQDQEMTDPLGIRGVQRCQRGSEQVDVTWKKLQRNSSWYRWNLSCFEMWQLCFDKWSCGLTSVGTNARLSVIDRSVAEKIKMLTNYCSEYYVKMKSAEDTFKIVFEKYRRQKEYLKSSPFFVHSQIMTKNIEKFQISSCPRVCRGLEGELFSHVLKQCPIRSSTWHKIS